MSNTNQFAQNDEELKAAMQSAILNGFNRSSDMLKTGLKSRFERTSNTQQPILPFDAMRNFEALQNFIEGALSATDWERANEQAETLHQLSRLNGERWRAAVNAMSTNLKSTNEGTVTP